MEETQTNPQTQDETLSPPPVRPAESDGAAKALAAERRRVAELQSKLSSYAEFDVNEYQSLKAAAEAREQEDLINAKKWSELQTRSTKQVEEALAQAKQAQLDRDNFMINSALTSAFYSAGGQQAMGDNPNYYAETLASQLAKNVKVIDGKPVAVDADGIEIEGGLNALVNKAKDGATSVFFAPQDQGKGVGSKPSSGSVSGGKIIVDGNDPIAVGKYSKEIVSGRAVVKY